MVKSLYLTGASHVGWGWKSQSGQVTHKKSGCKDSSHPSPPVFSMFSAVEAFLKVFCQGWYNTKGVYYQTLLGLLASELFRKLD